MRARLTRRRLLTAGAVAGAGVGAGAAGLVAYGGGAPGFVEAVVRRSFPGSPVPEEEMAAFARDYLARRDRVGYLVAFEPKLDPWARLRRAVNREKFQRRVYLNDAVRARLPRSWRASLEDAEREIVTLFALSTDVLSRPDPGAPVAYLGFVDPFEGACANPFAEFGTEEPATARLG